MKLFERHQRISQFWRQKDIRQTKNHHYGPELLNRYTTVVGTEPRMTSFGTFLAKIKQATP